MQKGRNNAELGVAPRLLSVDPPALRDEGLRECTLDRGAHRTGGGLYETRYVWGPHRSRLLYPRCNGQAVAALPGTLEPEVRCSPRAQEQMPTHMPWVDAASTHGCSSSAGPVRTELRECQVLGRLAASSHVLLRASKRAKGRSEIPAAVRTMLACTHP